MTVRLVWNGRPVSSSLPSSPSRPLSTTLPVHGTSTATPYPHPPNYDDLYPFQRAGVDWLRSRRRALLADEMGLGKSAQVLRALPRSPKAIVVCPAFLRSVWRDQAARWRPDLRVHVCRPGDFELPSEATGDLSVVSYESLPEAPRNPRQRSLFPGSNLAATTLIVDELHYCKNHKADRTRKVRALASQCGRAWGLTGTPMLGHPFDLWGTLAAIHLANDAFDGWQNFLDTFGAFRDRWGGYRFREPDLDVRDMLARVSLRRRREDVLSDLPRKVYQDIPCDAPTEIVAMLDGIAREWSASDDELPPFEMLSAVRAALAKARVPDLLDHVARYEDEKVPVVVFSAHREPVLSLGGRPGWMVVTGETPSDVREKAVILFQEGLLVGLAGTIQAMGVGLTLTRAAHALFVDLSYTPAENTQAEDRLVRIGQTASSVSIARMVADHPVDRRVLEILDQKAALIARAVG